MCISAWESSSIKIKCLLTECVSVSECDDSMYMCSYVMCACVPASSLRAEAEEEATGAPDGAVKPGRSLSDTQNPSV